MSKRATFSQTTVNEVLNDIRSGNDSYAKQFFAARPDWKEQDDKSSAQEQGKGEKSTKRTR